MHRVTHKRVVRREDGEPVTYTEGDTFEPTDAERRAFGDRLAPVNAGDSESNADGTADPKPDSESDETDDAPAASPPLDLDDMTVPEVEDALASGEYDDALDAIAQADGRKGVQQAVAARRETDE